MEGTVFATFLKDDEFVALMYKGKTVQAQYFKFIKERVPEYYYESLGSEKYTLKDI